MNIAEKERRILNNICLNCGERFSAGSVHSLYCSPECGYEYRKKHSKVERDKLLHPSITFTCAKCGKQVVTEEGSKDKRTRFCSKSCERAYWKHPPHESETNNCNYAEWQLEKRKHSCY